MLDKLRNSLNKYDIISFDIFDTLLLRPYAKPSNVFQHLEEINNSIGFYAVRKIAENNLRKYKDIEYANYDEIYSVLPSDFQFLKEKEIQLEKDTLYANPQMKEIFDYAKSLNKRIILISDMYFSTDILDDILKKNDFTGYEKIYISTEYRKAKYDVKLFKYILETLKIDPNKMLHIGDYEHSDYNCPRSLGIDAYLYTKPIEQLFINYPKIKIFFNENSEDLTCGIIIGILLKRFIFNKNIDDYWTNFGYYIGGPLCYGITKYVYDEIIKENIKDIIFIARDGYTIQKIFNIINNNKNIKDYYIYAQRSINIIVNMDFKNSNVWNYRIDTFINLFKELSEDLKNKCPKNFKNYEEKIDFIENNRNIIENISKKIYSYYLQYISKFNIKNNKLAIFDTSAGSFNSMKLIGKVFNKSKILGLYWLISSDEKDKFWCKSYQKDFQTSFLDYNILELLITAPEFPVKYINETGDFVLIDNEYERTRAEAYKFISEGEILFTKDLLKIFNDYEIKFNYLTIIKLVNTFLYNAEEKDIKHFSDIKHGVNEDHTIYEPLLIFKSKKINKLFCLYEDDKYKILYFLGIKITIKK